MSNPRPIGKYPLNIDADRAPVDLDGRHLGDGSTYCDRFRWKKQVPPAPTKGKSPATTPAK